MKIVIPYFLTFLALLFSCFPLCSAQIEQFLEGAAFVVNNKIQKGYLTGKVADNRYYALGNLFSFALPLALGEGFIEDHAIPPSSVGVALYNHDGFLLKIQYDPMIEEVRSLLASYPEIEEELLDALFYDMSLLQLEESVPGTKVLHEKKIVLEDGKKVLFAVIHQPQAATIIDAQTGTPLDAKRGFLFFFSKGTHLVNLSVQDTVSLIHPAADSSGFRLNERLLGNLLQIYGTFQH